MSDYYKLVKVINSCKTSAQNNVAYRMIFLYQKKWPNNKILTQELFDLCDENLYDIVAEAQRSEK